MNVSEDLLKTWHRVKNPTKELRSLWESYEDDCQLVEEKEQLLRTMFDKCDLAIVEGEHNGTCG